MTSKDVLLLGFDVGTTTSSCVVASATLSQSPITGQVYLDNQHQLSHFGPIFTPYVAGNSSRIDTVKLTAFFSELIESRYLKNIKPFASGAIITGLAAERDNAEDVRKLITTLIPNAVMATADDPHYESWLAFMSNAAEISEAYPSIPVVNIDIGGGTTNIAIGLNGSVISTGSYYIGARHIEFAPGSYQLTRMSRVGESVLVSLDISKQVGESLSESEVNRVCRFFSQSICNILDSQVVSETLVQAPLRLTDGALLRDSLITFSGGVGELYYAKDKLRQAPKAKYGDIGPELALALKHSQLVTKTERQGNEIIPEGLGRATLYGLAFHSAELSGNTILISKTLSLPLSDIPVIGHIYPNMSDKEMGALVSQASHFASGAAFYVKQVGLDAASILAFSRRLKEKLNQAEIPVSTPIVFLAEKNIGLTLGNLLTQWQTELPNLYVIDEVPYRAAKYIRIGEEQQGLVPVHFYAFGADNMCIDHAD